MQCDSSCHFVPAQSALSEARQQIGAGGCGTIAVQGLSLAFKRPQVTGNPIMDDVVRTESPYICS